MFTASQIFVFLLMADAAWVAYLLAKKKVAFNWIFIYWVLLTLKNLCDMMDGNA